MKVLRDSCWMLTARAGRSLLLLLLFVASALSEEVVLSGRHFCTEFGCWPSAWLLGCQKCGSTSLASVLHTSRVACYANLTGVNEGMPEFYRKETHFWDRVTYGGAGWNWKSFVELYPTEMTKECDSFLEATPGKFAMVEIARTIFESMPLVVRKMAKMVVVLREPIARDLSVFNHQRSIGLDWRKVCAPSQMTNFEEMIACELEVYKKYVVEEDVASSDRVKILKGFRRFRHKVGDISVWGSLYYNHLREWATYFDRRQIFVVSFEQLLVDSTTLDLVFSFVEGRERQDSTPVLPHINSKPHPTKRSTIDCDAVDSINEEIYDDWNDRLYSTLEEDRRLGRSHPLEPQFPRFERFPCLVRLSLETQASL